MRKKLNAKLKKNRINIIQTEVIKKLTKSKLIPDINNIVGNERGKRSKFFELEIETGNRLDNSKINGATIMNNIMIPNEQLIVSRGLTGDQGFTVGSTLTKDMANDRYTYEFDPKDYPSLFPGMAPFTSENIVFSD